MTKLRYINLGKIKPDFHCGMREYLNRINEEQVFVTCSPLKNVLLSGTSEKLNKYIKIENIPESMEILRTPPLTERKGIGFVLMSSNDIIFEGIFNNIKFTPTQLQRTIMAAKVKVLRKHGIQAEISLHRQAANDLIVKKDNKLLKFSGELVQKVEHRMILNSIITLDFNKDLAQKIFRLDTDKMKQRGLVKNMGEIITGLHELNSGLDYILGDEVAKTFAELAGFQLVKSELTKNEILKISELAEKLDNNNWKLYGKKPKL